MGSRNKLCSQHSSSATEPDPRLQLGAVQVDRLTLRVALDAIQALVETRRGAVVLTPNVDHVVRAESDEEFRAAYAAADLCLADGMPIVWSSRVLGARVPEKVSGSDLVPALMERAGEQAWRVFLLGGCPGVAEAAAALLRRKFGVDVVGTAAPYVRIGPGEPDPGGDAAVETIRDAHADLVLVAFGAPKQEIWMHRHREALSPAVLLGVGASLDFLAGRIRRAPRWMSNAGLEWLWRFAHEPRRLARRYFVDDPRFLAVLWREIRSRRRARSR